METTSRHARSALLLLAFALSSAPVLAGATFHVAENGNDDTGDGSPGDPWATIQHAVENVPDGSEILVGAGLYEGRVRLDQSFTEGIVVRSSTPYRARLRHTSTVVTVFTGQGITLEGFDIAHTGAGAGGLVIQVQDLIGEPGGAERVRRIVFRDNVIHDSYNNDLLKVNNGAAEVTIEGNIFYNQSGSDEHLDINGVEDVVIQDNVFFNDFVGSGRPNDNSTSSYIVIKDSNPINALDPGARRVIVRRNIFLHWEGSTGSNFVLAGEDGQDFHEAFDITIENNLMLGDSGNTMRAPLGVKGCRDILFRNNTVVGDLPSNAFAMRLNTEGSNLPNENVEMYNNIWSDPGGTMIDFSDTPIGETTSFSLENNLYWNGGSTIPDNPGGDLVNPSDDTASVVGDPLLPTVAGIVLPRLDPPATIPPFADGSSSIREAFERLAAYASPGEGAAIDLADPTNAPADDLLGRSRGDSPDIGALESGVVFADGFESGDLEGWDAAVP